MKNVKRVFIVVIAMMSMWSTLVLAKAGSYSSTYDMNHGVLSKIWIKPKSKCSVTVSPKIGTKGQDMGIIWANKNIFGVWDGPQKFVSSTKGGTKTFKSSSKRKVYLRNYTGKKWTGYVNIKWD